MSDIKHIEYCIKLGNTFVTNNIDENIKKQELNMSTNYSKIYQEENLDFRARLQNWK